jgi:dipeptidyl aminopeptidase/acylaminoacyl peptidase
MRILTGLVLALVAMPAFARPYTVDDMLQLEGYGQVLAAPGGVIITRQARYDSASDYRYDSHMDRPLSKLLIADRGRAAEPLFAQAADAGYWAAGLSPRGKHLAVFRLKAGRLSSGVVDIARREVRWFDYAPDMPVQAPGALWTSDTQFLQVAMPGTQLPVSLDFGGLAQRLARAGWAKAEAGAAASVDVRGSGRFLTHVIAAKTLRRVDAASGHADVLMTADIADIALSADRRHVAVVHFGESLQPEGDAPIDPAFQVRRRRLSVVDLETGAVTAPCPACDVLPNLLAWSPSGARLLFYARMRGDWSGGRLHVYGARTQRLQALDTGAAIPVIAREFGSSLVLRAGWMGAVPAALAKPPGGRADWYALAPGRAPRNLTRALADPPGPLTALSANGLQLVAGDKLLEIDGNARVHARFEGVEATGLTPLDIYGLGPRLLTTPPERAIVTVRRGDARTVHVGERRIPLGHDDALVALGPDGTAVALDRSTVAETLRRAETRIPIDRINAHLAEVDTADAIPIDGVTRAGAPVRHWLLRPKGARGKLPVVVIPYPGATFSDAPPAPAINRVQAVVNGELLAARGYGVLYPGLPLAETPGEPMQDLAAEIVAALDAAGDTGLVDTGRAALWGHSYGGYAALATAAGTARFRAIIASAAISDLAGGYGSMDPRTDLDRGMMLTPGAGWFEAGQGRMGVPLWENPQRYIRNSPLYAAPKMTTPLLLIHGDVDFVPVAHAERMFTALYRLDRDAVLVRYRGAAHAPASPANIRDQWTRVFDWLERHLGDARDQP